MEKITYDATVDGITFEHMIRSGHFNMRVNHFHPQYEIFYILEGERLFFFHNRTFIASQGDLILVDTNLIHMTRSVSDADAGHNRIILYVTADQMEKFDQQYPQLNLVRFFHQNPGVYHLTPAQQKQFMDLYRLFKREFRDKKRHYKQAIELAVTSYLLSLTRDLDYHSQELPLSQSDGKYRHVYEIADYLSEHCCEQISLDELAGQFFLSKYYICRLFKEITGYTILEFISIHRIRKAQQLLETTDHSIAAIAEMVGYGSITQFEQIFKTYMLISPLRYRKTKNIPLVGKPQN